MSATEINANPRKIIVTSQDGKVDTDSIAQILASHITGGDYAGYIQKLAEKEHAQKPA